MFTTTKIATEPIMIKGAQQALEDVLEHEELFVKRDPLHVGNQRGLSLINLPGEMAIVKAELASTKMELASTKMRVFSLETRTGDLTASLGAYKKIRHRFIDTHARIKTANVSAHTRKQIQEGSAAAHGGDVKIDADLYREGKQRKDVEIFKDLYGILPQVVWSFSK